VVGLLCELDVSAVLQAVIPGPGEQPGAVAERGCERDLCHVSPTLLLLPSTADRADDRAYFFPDPLHTPVALLATVVYNVLLALRVCTPFSAADVTASNSQAQARDSANLATLLGPHSGTRVGSARAEAERRRALALKALDQQLHAAANKNSTGAPPSTVLGETSLDHADGP